jgi:hypothetical protein
MGSLYSHQERAVRFPTDYEAADVEMDLTTDETPSVMEIEDDNDADDVQMSDANDGEIAKAWKMHQKNRKTTRSAQVNDTDSINLEDPTIHNTRAVFHSDQPRNPAGLLDDDVPAFQHETHQAEPLDMNDRQRHPFELDLKLPAEAEFTRSFSTHTISNGTQLAKDDAIELQDGTFFKIREIYIEYAYYDGERRERCRLVGWTFILNGTLPQALHHRDYKNSMEDTAVMLMEQPNEICWVIDMLKDDQRIHARQGRIGVSALMYKRHVRIRMTNRLWPSGNDLCTVPQLWDIDPEQQHGIWTLVCRWRATRTWPNTAIRDANTHTYCERTIERLSYSECDEDFRDTEDDLMKQFRGETQRCGEQHGRHLAEIHRKIEELANLPQDEGEDCAHYYGKLDMNILQTTTALEADASCDPMWRLTSAIVDRGPWHADRSTRYSIGDAFSGRRDLYLHLKRR